MWLNFVSIWFSGIQPTHSRLEGRNERIDQICWHDCAGNVSLQKQAHDYQLVGYVLGVRTSITLARILHLSLFASLSYGLSERNYPPNSVTINQTKVNVSSSVVKKNCRKTGEHGKKKTKTGKNFGQKTSLIKERKNENIEKSFKKIGRKCR